MQEGDIANSYAHATQHSHRDSRPLPWTCGQSTGALACRANNRWRRVGTAVKEMSTSQRGLYQQTHVCRCGIHGTMVTAMGHAFSKVRQQQGFQWTHGM